MTPLDAAGLAVLGLSSRRLTATLLRVYSGRATAEDLEALPPREANEALLRWASRCASSPSDPSRGEDTCSRVTREAAGQLDRAAALGIRAIPFGAADYPIQLTRIGDPPLVLWCRGVAEAWSKPTVALVGSRAATPHGLAMARRLATDLAGAGVVVVSGLARGIDAAAHAAALAAGGRTIGVLGCGPDRIYPREHADLARDMERAGCVLSEFPPGVAPLPHHFPLRNRIISGLSLAVVVVEAAEKSGALITASAAAEQGREVMVVPGPSLTGRNRGGHLLLRDGAAIVESAADVLEHLGANGTLPVPASAATDLSGEALDFTVDDVAARTGEPPGLVLARLLELELAGQIQRIGGGRFVRVLT